MLRTALARGNSPDYLGAISDGIFGIGRSLDNDLSAESSLHNGTQTKTYSSSCEALVKHASFMADAEVWDGLRIQ